MTQNERESHYKKTVILVQVFTDMRWPYFNVFGRFYFCECNVHESKPLAVFGPEHDVQSDAGLYLNSFDMLSDSIYRKKKQKKKKNRFLIRLSLISPSLLCFSCRVRTQRQYIRKWFVRSNAWTVPQLQMHQYEFSLCAPCVPRTADPTATRMHRCSETRHMLSISHVLQISCRLCDRW